ncbi:GyrI-like domain-containing protein [Microbacterium sp. CIAB417]|uniref:GyrI-like domain-containing protein n=1 Tax=Microbacterium sp. CIAB417 TaxID=2860287 RepID=UPI001FAD70E7|nr:GyrI-like domain-containing protein [Microbacterium sp. CIAB417]
MRYDLKRDLGALYKPRSGRFVRVDVPEMRYLAIDGHGDPNTEPAYRAAVEALYVSGYQVRSAFKRRTGSDFVVGPLEGLWSSEDPATFVQGRKSDWDWTMLIPLPAPVSTEDVAEGLAAASAKKPDLPLVTHLTMTEGLCLQTLHIGSYDDEAPVLAHLHDELMPELGFTWNGRHHEIYLGDPRRTAPEKLRTILRQPVAPA